MEVLKNVKKIAQKANKDFNKAMADVVDKATKIEDSINLRKSLNEARKEYKNMCEDLTDIILSADIEKFPKDVAECVEEVKDYKLSIEKMEEKLNATKYKRCPKCRNFTFKEDSYCPNCGYQFTFDLED